MPGAYAHITLVNILKEPQTLEAIPGFPEEALSAVLDYFKSAVKNAGRVWNMAARGVLAGDQTYLTGIGNWDLDTGRDGAGKLVFWG